jgi:molybdate transport system substrate-binding protein
LVYDLANRKLEIHLIREASVKRAEYLFPVVLVALLFGSPVNARAQGEVTLLAPSPTRKPLDRILQNFQSKSGQKVKVTYSGARTTTQSVAKGDGQDVSLVVAPVTGALTSGAVIPDSMTLVASYQTAFIVPKGAPKPDISNAAAVKKALLAAKAIGYEDPDFASAGWGPAEAIHNLGIGDQIAAKSRLCANNTTYSPTATNCFDPAGTGGTRSTLTTQKGLMSGKIDVGLLYLSDVLAEKDNFTIVGVLPRDVYTPTGIVGFISKRASDPAKAKALLQYLASPEAQTIFKEEGFEPHK